MDTRRPRSLRDFIELARRKTAESRSELVGNIADLFLSDAVRLSDRERALMTGILRSLIATVESALLQELTAIVGERGDLPEALRPLLSGRSVEITRPILMASPALQAPQLVELVKYRSREHQLAVAMRPSLTSDAADHGATPDGGDAIEELLRDADDSLSRAASEYLVAESERIDRLKMPLLALADLPAGLARRLHWWVAAALRAHVVDALSVSPTYIDSHIEAAARGAADRHTVDGAGIAAQAGRLIERMAEADPLTVATLSRLVQAGRIPAFIAGLAHFADLPWAVAQRIVLRPDGQSLAILCKASGVDGEGFLALHALISSVPAGTARLPTEDRNSILGFYDKVTKGNARAALGFWRRDPQFISAMEEVSPVAEEPPASR